MKKIPLVCMYVNWLSKLGYHSLPQQLKDTQRGRLQGIQNWAWRKKTGIDQVARGRLLIIFAKSHIWTYLSGLSEAHTESISPTSKVPWEGAKTEAREPFKYSTHHHNIPRLWLSKQANKKRSFLMCYLQNTRYLRPPSPFVSEYRQPLDREETTVHSLKKL